MDKKMPDSFRGPTHAGECAAVTHLVPLVAAGAASETQAAEVRRHVSGCSVCRRRLEDARRLVLALTEDGADLRCAAPGVTAGVTARLADRLARPAGTKVGVARPERRGVRSMARGMAWRLGPAAVAYLTVLAAVVYRLPQPGAGSWAWLGAFAYAAVAIAAVPLALIPRRLSDEEE